MTPYQRLAAGGALAVGASMNKVANKGAWIKGPALAGALIGGGVGALSAEDKKKGGLAGAIVGAGAGAGLGYAAGRYLPPFLSVPRRRLRHLGRQAEDLGAQFDKKEVQVRRKANRILADLGVPDSISEAVEHPQATAMMEYQVGDIKGIWKGEPFDHPRIIAMTRRSAARGIDQAGKRLTQEGKRLHDNPLASVGSRASLEAHGVIRKHDMPPGTISEFADRMTKTFSEKTADVNTALQPHQERVRRKLQANDGLVVAHDMGSGKTLSSIAVANDVSAETPDAKMTVVTPAALQENYRKELRKHTGTKDEVMTVHPSTVTSQAKFTRNGPPEGEQDLLIVDEAHRARSVGSKFKQQLKDTPAKKRMLMTGTPIYNHPFELGPLVNIAAGGYVLPETQPEFEKRWVKEQKVWPKGLKGLAYRLRGGTPGLVPSLTPDDQLNDALSKYVDYHKPDTDNPDFPRLREETVRVPMSKEQQRIYDYMMGELPPHLKKKVQMDLPPNKQEASKLVTFLNGPRQVANTVYGHHEGMDMAQAATNSPKMQAILKRIEENPDQRRLIYSNFLDAGVEPLTAALAGAGVQYGRYTGADNKKLREEAVRAFNDGKTNTLLVSSAGGEGLDLKGVREVHVMEPHWNEQKLNQVVARARRYGSHAHLPEDERDVTVFRYLSETPSPGVGNKIRSLFGRPQKMDDTAESYIHNRAQEKQRLIGEMEDLMAKQTVVFQDLDAEMKGQKPKNPVPA